jgi:ABC-type glycerol-3-phosphate transport system substrate-binding protein
MGTGDVPDVGDMFFLQSRVLQGRGKWGPLDITQEVNSGAFGRWDRFVPVARREAVYKGAIYGIPWRIDIRTFIYNTDLWPSVPATYNDFAQMANSTLTSKKLIAAASTLGNPYQQLNLIAAAWGLQFLTPDLKHSTLMDPRWVQVCTWIQSMVNKRVLLQQAGTNLTLPPFDNFLEGRVAVLFGGNHQVVPTAQGSAPQMVSKIASGLMPKGPAGKHLGTASTAQFSIFESTKSKNESLQWVRFLTSPSINKQWSLVSGQDPSDTVVQNMMANSFTRPIYLQSRTSFGIDQPTPAWAEISASPNGPATKLAIDIYSGANIHTALSQAHAGIEAILAKYH